MNHHDRLPTVAPARKWLLSLAFGAMGLSTIAGAQTAPAAPAPKAKPAKASQEKSKAAPGKPKSTGEKPAPEPAQGQQKVAGAENAGSALPDVTVSAPKLGKDLLSLPLSATVVTGDTINQTATRTIRDAAIYSPNTFFSDFTARAVSSPHFRGIGGSPGNPGVTSYYDGVPQLHGNSSSLELLDIDQIDIVRGPLGSLYGRNTAAGLVNVTSVRPSLSSFGGEFESTFGNYNLYDFRGKVTGPLIQDQLGFSFAGGYNERDGYTKNAVTGHDLDNRSAYFGKAQLLWVPNEQLEVRFIVSGESDNDGDYALNDLASLRRNPRVAARDFEGFTKREVIQPTLQVTYHADSFDFTSTTGYVYWSTVDTTDLDYLPLPFATRYHEEHMNNWTQEFRFSNPAGKPITLSEEATLSWQAGVFLFRADFDEAVANTLNPPISPIPGTLISQSTASLTDTGVGTYAQGTLSLWKKLDITAGLRWDFEHKEAALFGTTIPALPGATTSSNPEREFSQVTPQASISYHIDPDTMAYFAFAGGFKAGGFNPAGPAAYEEETSWNYELGIKGRALNDNLQYGLAVFYTDWRNLQLNQPLGAPGTFFIANAGNATARGIEMNLNYRVCSMMSVFGSAGWQDTQFLSDARDSGVALGGRNLPYAPNYTITVGTQIEVPVSASLNAYGRIDAQFIGNYNYDAQNTISQSSYTLLNLRLGVRSKTKGWFAEAFVNNALDTDYVPLAFSYALAPSGAVGESGAPCTFGLRAGVKF